MQLRRKAPRGALAATFLAALVWLASAGCTFSEAGQTVEPSGPRPQFPDFGDVDSTFDSSVDSSDQSVADLTVDRPPLEAAPEGSPPADRDGDGTPDGQDNCIDVNNPGQEDRDQDGVGDACDNCPDQPNSDQKDLDGDGLGDVCDNDRDQDGVPNPIDWRPDVKDDVLYFKSIGDNLNDYFGFPGGSFSAGSDPRQMCITATDAQVRRVRLKTLGASDVVVQTRALVSNNSGSKLSWASVGVTARVSSIGNANFDAYSCEVDLTNRRLTLIAWDNAADTGIAATPINSVTLAASYTLRIEVKGSALRCSLVGGPSVTGTSSKWASGTAGVVTFRTAACFDYLLVMRAP